MIAVTAAEKIPSLESTLIEDMAETLGTSRPRA
jgi:hypothetical protein